MSVTIDSREKNAYYVRDTLMDTYKVSDVEVCALPFYSDYILSGIFTIGIQRKRVFEFLSQLAEIRERIDELKANYTIAALVVEGETGGSPVPAEDMPSGTYVFPAKSFWNYKLSLQLNHGMIVESTQSLDATIELLYAWHEYIQEHHRIEHVPRSSTYTDRFYSSLHCVHGFGKTVIERLMAEHPDITWYKLATASLNVLTQEYGLTDRQAAAIYGFVRGTVK